MSNSTRFGVVTALCALALSCANSTGADDTAAVASDEGQLQMDLNGIQTNGQVVAGAPGQLGQVEQINVTIRKVTAHSPSQGWVELFSGPPVTIDLLNLKNNATTLGFKNVPAGKITQIRLYTTEGATQNVVLKGGQTVDLKVPSGVQSGIKVHGVLDVTACQKQTLALGFVGHKSIWVHPTGQGDLWILRPVIKASLSQGTAINCGTPGGGGSGGGSGTTNPNNPNGGTINPNSPKDPIDPLAPGGGSGSTNPSTPPLIETGGSCSASVACLSGTCVAGVCGGGASGAPCTANLGCTSQLCSAGTCAPPMGAGGTGSVCSASSMCLSASCINGVCDPGATGQTCNVSNDCTNGLSCVAGSCVVPIN